MASKTLHLCILLAALLFFASPTAAFGAGNIASISAIEGHNWRHGDIEDMLKTIAFLRGKKWTSMMVKRVYFGNWLRDYSQALDVGTLTKVQGDALRILVWVLSFLSFGYATGEFEVTAERLGVYRPEEHIDNPKDYADNQDARKYDPRLRGPIQPVELQIDPETGMKNYIANERLGIATSAGYIKFSLSRSIHFGRVYTSGNNRGRDEDIAEALRCLGQALHCMEDFGAHTNYVELVLRELGYRDVFPHTGTSSEINLRGHRVYPLVTGTFGMVDFLHSVIGEATDHFAQSEVEQMDTALGNAQKKTKESETTSRGGPDGSGGSSLSSMTGLLSQMPGTGDLVKQAQDLSARSEAQERASSTAEYKPPTFEGPPGSSTGPPGPTIPGTSIDPVKTIASIYPILEFRDRVAKAISATIEKIPGLSALVEKITETLTLFILGLLAPFIRPIINAVSDQLKNGSSGVIDASGRHQYEPWTDPHCTDPTHSLLSKDHFSNILNAPAGQVASAIVMYVAPRVIYAWEHPDIPVDQVLNDVTRVFHHPATRDHSCELHRNMYSTVEKWARSRPDGGQNLNYLLGSQSVRDGKNHTKSAETESQGFAGLPGMSSVMGRGHSHAGGHTASHAGGQSQGSHGMPHIPGVGQFMGSYGQNLPHIPHMPHGFPGAGTGGSREVDDPASIPNQYPGTQTQYDHTRPPPGPEAGYASQPMQGDPYAQPPNPPSGQYQQQPQYPPQGYPSPQPPYGQQPPPQGYYQGGPPPGQYYGSQY